MDLLCLRVYWNVLGWFQEAFYDWYMMCLGTFQNVCSMNDCHHEQLLGLNLIRDGILFLYH